MRYFSSTTKRNMKEVFALELNCSKRHCKTKEKRLRFALGSYLSVSYLEMNVSLEKIRSPSAWPQSHRKNKQPWCLSSQSVVQKRWQVWCSGFQDSALTRCSGCLPDIQERGCTLSKPLRFPFPWPEIRNKRGPLKGRLISGLREQECKSIGA